MTAVVSNVTAHRTTKYGTVYRRVPAVGTDACLSAHAPRALTLSQRPAPQHRSPRRAMPAGKAGRPYRPCPGLMAWDALCRHLPLIPPTSAAAAATRLLRQRRPPTGRGMLPLSLHTSQALLKAESRILERHGSMYDLNNLLCTGLYNAGEVLARQIEGQARQTAAATTRLSGGARRAAAARAATRRQPQASAARARVCRERCRQRREEASAAGVAPAMARAGENRDLAG